MVERPGFSDEAEGTRLAKPPKQIAFHRKGLKARLPPTRQRQSLARRLAMTYLLTTLLILIGLGAAIYFFTDIYLDRQLETELAAQLHSYYYKHRFISEDADLTQARLWLVQGVKTVLAHGLGILGVTAPESM